MGSFSLVIYDFGERNCDYKNCKFKANQYRVTVINSKAVVKKSCKEHYKRIMGMQQ